MVKVEIDITKELENAIQKEVEKQLAKGGLLRFIRETIRYQLASGGWTARIKKQESEIMQLKKSMKDFK